MKRRGKRRIPVREKEPLDQPLFPNSTWSMDFMSDSLVSGQRFRTLNILDDYNVKCFIRNLSKKITKIN